MKAKNNVVVMCNFAKKNKVKHIWIALNKEKEILVREKVRACHRFAFPLYNVGNIFYLFTFWYI